MRPGPGEGARQVIVFRGPMAERGYADHRQFAQARGRGGPMDQPEGGYAIDPIGQSRVRKPCKSNDAWEVVAGRDREGNPVRHSTGLQSAGDGAGRRFRPIWPRRFSNDSEDHSFIVTGLRIDGIAARCGRQ